MHMPPSSPIAYVQHPPPGHGSGCVAPMIEQHG
jgi:hypothetical protein